MATRTEKAIALGPEDLSLGQDLFGIGAYLCGLVFRGTALVEMGRLDEAASDLDRASQHPAEQYLDYGKSLGVRPDVLRAKHSVDFRLPPTLVIRVLEGASFSA
jgi:hypothetical protein